MKEYLQERRKAERVATDPRHPVEVQVMGNGFLEVVNAVNISILGVGIFLNHGLDDTHLGKHVEIVLTLPGCKAMFLRGLVRYLDGYEDKRYLGLEFSRLPPAAEAQLQRYISANRHRSILAPSSRS
ncbi:MAG: hypothetical protein RJA70_3304 [Pseudomonadota bacterium]